MLHPTTAIVTARDRAALWQRVVKAMVLSQAALTAEVRGVKKAVRSA